MDETDAPQTPPELLVILVAMADEKIPVQTIAPKFTGRFNKGVDYVGDLQQFTREFSDDLAVIDYVVKQYGLPKTLKLSVSFWQRQVFTLSDHSSRSGANVRWLAHQDSRDDLVRRVDWLVRSWRRWTGIGRRHLWLRAGACRRICVRLTPALSISTPKNCRA